MRNPTAVTGKVRMAPWVRLVREPGTVPGERIRSARDVQRLVRPVLDAEEVEIVLVLVLDAQSQVRATVEVTRGILDGSLVHPREVFRAAIALGAAGIILVHNHPSGDPTPSTEDQAITRQMVAAGALLDIPVYDHVIVGGGRYTSLAEKGML